MVLEGGGGGGGGRGAERNDGLNISFPVMLTLRIDFATFEIFLHILDFNLAYPVWG